MYIVVTPILPSSYPSPPAPFLTSIHESKPSLPSLRPSSDKPGPCVHGHALPPSNRHPRHCRLQECNVGVQPRTKRSHCDEVRRDWVDDEGREVRRPAEAKRQLVLSLTGPSFALLLAPPIAVSTFSLQSSTLSWVFWRSAWKRNGT